MWPECVLRCCFANTSDHKPLKLCPEGHIRRKVVSQRRFMQGSFKFEPMWLREAKFTDFVGTTWVMANQECSKLSDKLQCCGSKLYEWNRNTFGKFHLRIKNLNDQLETLSKMERSEEVIANEMNLSTELDECLAREELLWKQRSRMDWLKEGDKNTTFFKMKATQRKAKKFVKFLKMEDGSIVTNSKVIIDEFSNYYKDLLQEEINQDTIYWD